MSFLISTVRPRVLACVLVLGGVCVSSAGLAAETGAAVEKGAAAETGARHAELPATPAAIDAESLYQLESQWTRADGKSMPLSELRGKVRVLAIFYSSCEYACPIIVGRMKLVQASLPEKLRGDAGFVLVSMDVANDDPARLKEYAKRMELEGDWTLLRGSDGDVRELGALLGFRYRQEKDGGFAHSNMFTVLDREGRVAYQSMGLESDVADAVKAVNKLLVP